MGMQLAKITWLLLPKPPVPSSVKTQIELVVPSEQSLSLDVVLQSLTRFNPWERPLPKKVAPPPPPPPAPKEKAVVTKLALDLIGTMVLPDDASWAILLRQNKRNQQISLRLGEEVDGAILERIERRAVFLRNHGRLEKLSMAGDEDKKMEGPVKKVAVTKHRGERERGNKLSRQAYTQLISKGMGLLAGVNITPFYQGANSVGYRLKFSESNADMHQLGLVNGDVIKKVNGIRVVDQKKLTRFVPKLKKQSSLRIDVLRNNRPETIQLHIGQ